MKKFFKLKNSVIFVLIIVFAYIGFSYLNKKRYELKTPMPDLEYKKSIIKASPNPFYTLERLRPLMGEEELTQFIKDNNNNEQIYTPIRENRYNGAFRANLHNHTINSDGQASVKKLLDKAQKYAELFINDGYMVIGITDHNTVLGAQEIIKILEKYPNRYPNLKIVAGMEINSNYRFENTPVEIHVLAWCINPYDKYLNKEFYKKDKKDKYNRRETDAEFEKLIKNMTKYSLVGIAHPARYLENIEERKRPLYINTMLKKYKTLTDKTPYIEAYYQSYNQNDMKKFENVDENHIEKYIKELDDGSIEMLYGERFMEFTKYIRKTADNLGIIKTGSTDSHSFSIFRR